MLLQPNSVRFSFVRPTLTLEIEGYNRPKLLKSLTEKGIIVKKMRILDAKTTQIIIFYKDSEKTFAICQELCYTYRVRSSSGALKFLRTNLKRWGIIVGIALSIALTVFLSGFVQSVEIVGNETVSERELVLLLNGNGLGVGSRITTDVKENATALVRSHERIADCAVSVKGCKLIVSVIEREQPLSPSPERNSVVSSYDAVVSRVICSSGTAKVKSGDIVRRGEELIEGATYSTNGEERYEVCAKGTVYGIVTHQKTEIITENAKTLKRTGRKSVNTTFSIFGLTLFPAKSPYALYEKTEQTRSLFGIKTTSTTFFETTEEIKSKEEQIEEFKERTLLEFFGGEIKEVKTLVVPINSDAFKVTVYVLTERIIS